MADSWAENPWVWRVSFDRAGLYPGFGRPILFSPAMVLAIMEGRKSQTRRVLQHPEYYGCPTGDCPHGLQSECDAAMNEADNLKDCPYGAPQSLLWVREAFRLPKRYDNRTPAQVFAEDRILPVPTRWEADGTIRAVAAGDVTWGRYRNARFLPRLGARIWIRVTDVRLQRLQDITEEDAVAEGIWGKSHGPVGPISAGESFYFGAGEGGFDTAIKCYSYLWDTLHKPEAPRG